MDKLRKKIEFLDNQNEIFKTDHYMRSIDPEHKDSKKGTKSSKVGKNHKAY